MGTATEQAVAVDVELRINGARSRLALDPRVRDREFVRTEGLFRGEWPHAAATPGIKILVGWNKYAG